jgi:hypothetical protein
MAWRLPAVADRLKTVEEVSRYNGVLAASPALLAAPRISSCVAPASNWLRKPLAKTSRLYIGREDQPFQGLQEAVG